MVNKVWILYANRGDRWQHNNRTGADKIARQLAKIVAFFEKPGLEFGTQEDLPPNGDPDSSLLDFTIIMDDGTQLNLQAVVSRKISDIEEP